MIRVFQTQSQLRFSRIGEGYTIMRHLRIHSLLVCLIIASACSTGPQQYVDKANKLFNSGKYAEADINYQKAIQKDPRFGEAYYRLGLSQFKQGKLGDAYQTLSQARVLLPGRTEVAVALADDSFAGYIQNTQGGQAATFYAELTRIVQRLLQQDPNSYDGLRLKGYVAMVDKHFPEAVESLKKADAVKPMQADVIDALVQCLFLSAHQGKAKSSVQP